MWALSTDKERTGSGETEKGIDTEKGLLEDTENTHPGAENFGYC